MLNCMCPFQETSLACIVCVPLACFMIAALLHFHTFYEIKILGYTVFPQLSDTMFSPQLISKSQPVLLLDHNHTK